MLRFPLPAPATELAFSPDGRLLAASAVDVVWLHDSYSGRLERALVPPAALGGAPSRPLFAPDGLRLAVSHPGGLMVWSVSSGRLLCELPPSWVGPAFAPCGKTLATVGGMSDPAEVAPKWSRPWFWAALSGDLLRDRVRFARGPLTRPVAAWYDPGGLLVVAQADGLRRFDPGTGEEREPVRFPDTVTVRAAVPDGPGAVVLADRTGGRWAGRRRWAGFAAADADGFRPLLDLALRGRAVDWAVAPDGRLAVRAEGDTVHTFDLLTGGHAGGLDPGLGPLSAVAVSGDGLRLAAAGRAGACVWDADG